MAKKVQVVALIDPALRTQVDALRIVTKDSRARVIEQLLSVGLAETAERLTQRDYKRIVKLAAAAGVSYEAYVEAYSRAYVRETYGPGLEALEADDSAVRAQLA